MDDVHPSSDTIEEESTIKCNGGGLDDNEDPCFLSDDDDDDDDDDFVGGDDGAADALLEEIKEDEIDLLTQKLQDYKILNMAEIRQRMEHDVAEVSSVLSISENEASILLRHHNWSVSKVNDSWFTNESQVREKVGLLEKPPVMGSEFSSSNKRKIITCGICFESYTSDSIRNADCGHLYCEICWSAYISTSINNDGTGCLMLRCPDPSCRASVGQDMIDSLASGEDRKRYSDFLVRSYVEDNRTTKWCPSPDCEYAVEFSGTDDIFDVTCHCLTSFCWNCEEECHRPMDCDTVKKWVLKNSSESENVNYILAYCKPCPHCKRPIEKNRGCMHMTCRVCHNEFCWLCLGPWRAHANCNRYMEKTAKEDKRKKLAKESLEKYTHYFERWDANRKSKVKALADHQRVKDEEFKKLSDSQDIPEPHLEFITKAWLQVVECRRALEWSYAYGFYLPDNESAKKQFFEYLQGEAESTLEKLHNCVESELREFLDVDGLSNKFKEFRTKLVGLTTVTGNYFEKLVRALENGLSDVNSQRIKGSENEEVLQDCWRCDRCTYANPFSVQNCKMCVSLDDDHAHE